MFYRANSFFSFFPNIQRSEITEQISTVTQPNFATCSEVNQI